MSWRKTMGVANHRIDPQYPQKPLEEPISVNVAPAETGAFDGDRLAPSFSARRPELSDHLNLKVATVPTSDADLEVDRDDGKDRVHKGRQGMSAPLAVELVYVEPQAKIVPANPKFPPCRVCLVARYWITDSAKVVCGRCGETRFILESIEYHPIS